VDETEFCNGAKQIQEVVCHKHPKLSVLHPPSTVTVTPAMVIVWLCQSSAH